MFESTATKLAHSPTLATGSSDLRPLQQVIAIEELVSQSYVHAATSALRILIDLILHFWDTETQRRLCQVHQCFTDMGRW